MHLSRQHDQLTVKVHPLELRLLQQIFQALIANYATPPDQMDPRIRQVWYSTRGCASANLSAEETREWVENLHRFKSTRRHLLERLNQQLAAAKATGSQLRLRLDEATELMVALNDHRLWLAAQHDIGQEEMDCHSLASLAAIQSPQRDALFQIHLLAQFVDELLHYISPEAASWMED